VSSSSATYGFRSASGGGGGGGGCCKEGTFYITVCAEGTPAENAQELLDAYTQAQSLSPTKDNVITILLCPGEYAFNGPFKMDTEYINIATLTGNRDAIFDRSDVVDPVTLSPSFDVAYCLSIKTNEVFVKGIEGKVRNSPNWDSFAGIGTDFRLPIDIASSLLDYFIENCNGGDLGFGSDLTFGGAPRDIGGVFTDCDGGLASFAFAGTASGTFTNCIGVRLSFGGDGGTASGIFTDCLGGEFSFGGSGTADGTFTNCLGSIYSFGGDGTADGTFTGCQGRDESFGGRGGTASGTFTNCIGGKNSFGGRGGTASGTFRNCQGEDVSFGGQGTASGTFTNCQGFEDSFGGAGTASGTFTNCIGGSLSFGGDNGSNIGTASGIFTDCIGGYVAFGGLLTASGTFTNCQGGDGSFGGFGGTADGTFTDCKGGDRAFGGDGGNADGIFNYCEGGDLSFGGSGTLSGNLYFCRITTGTFETPSGGGSITLGIDGSNNIITI
jgi:hypothetical protein